MQSSDEASTEAELLQIDCKRTTGAFTTGSGGGTATVFKGSGGDTAHNLSTIKRNNTTQAVAGAGTIENIPALSGVFNVLAGEWERTPTPEIRPILGVSEGLIVSLSEAPADQLTLRAVAAIEITGG